MKNSCMLVLAAFAAPAVVAAQASHSHAAPAQATAAAIKQIQNVEKAIAPLKVIDSARVAGFEPVLGWLPTMGTHWISSSRMRAGRSAPPTEPSQLMFSPMGGKETLVGAAFSYYTTPSDTTRPNIFDGNPPWHDHPDLAPAGSNLVMLHVWFVPSPDGPFAGHNPFLPYYALGLTPPDIERMKDAAVSLRVRKAALALAEVVDTAGLFPTIARRAPVRAVLNERRAAVRAAMPKLEAARKANDVKAWDAIADELASHWDAMQAAYLKSAVNPAANARIVKYFDDMLGRGAHPH